MELVTISDQHEAPARMGLDGDGDQLPLKGRRVP